MKTGKPDFVGFVLWPVIGGGIGWLLTALFYLKFQQRRWPEPWLILVAIASVCLVATWAGRRLIGSASRIWALGIGFGVVGSLMPPSISAMPESRVTVLFGDDHFLFAHVDYAVAGSVIGTMLTLFRCAWKQRKTEDVR